LKIISQDKMSSTSDDAADKLEALLWANTEEVVSEDELQSAALAANLLSDTDLSGQERKLKALLSKTTLGAVAEDFVELSVPGFRGSMSSGGSSREVAVSLMMSVVSSSGASRGGSFSTEVNSGKEFLVVRITKEDKLCLSGIGDGAKFCLKNNCSISSHKNTNVFKLDDEGVIVIAKSRDAAFAMPVLGEECSLNPFSMNDWLH
jgi:hypothetical protein